MYLWGTWEDLYLGKAARTRQCLPKWDVSGNTGQYHMRQLVAVIFAINVSCEVYVSGLMNVL